jgi:hypothetical protein
MRILGSGLVADECDALDPTSALLGETRSRVVDENPSHQTGRNAKEMGSVAPLEMPLIDEADVGLVHESGWLQRMAGGFAPHLSGGHAPEIIVDEWDELVERVLPAIAYRKEQLRNPADVRRVIGHRVP